MANTYKRKRISSLHDLDREESKLRKKAKAIEEEWAEMLNPQQLAVSFLTDLIGKKIRNKVAKTVSSKEETPAATSSKKGKKKSSLKKTVRIIGLSIVVSFAVKKILQVLQNRKAN